jgi:WD40 repeat protein
VCASARSVDRVTYLHNENRDRRSLGSSQKPSGVLIGHTEGITNVSAKGDGRYVISNGKDQALRLWDLRKMHTNAEYEKVANDFYGIRHYDYRYLPPAFIRSSPRISFVIITIVFQLWAISETKASRASVGLQRHDVPRARRAPDPHPLSLQSFRDDGRAVHILRICRRKNTRSWSLLRWGGVFHVTDSDFVTL